MVDTGNFIFEIGLSPRGFSKVCKYNVWEWLFGRQHYCYYL